MRILVIDDDDDVCEILSVLLAAEGHEVETHTDGWVALESLRAGYRPSLILLDIMMPTLTGEAFIKAMREIPGTTDIPVVILTGHRDAREKAASLGVGCLVKPVELFDLLQTVQRVERGVQPTSRD
jgi:CheY-like chemotaxis protein